MVTRPNGFTDANSMVGNSHASHRVSYLGLSLLSAKESYIDISESFHIGTPVSVNGAADCNDSIVDRFSFPLPQWR